MHKLDEKVQRKIDYALQLLKMQERLSTKFVKAVGDGLFELRIEYEGNIYTRVRDKKSLIKVGNLANILYLYR